MNLRTLPQWGAQRDDKVNSGSLFVERLTSTSRVSTQDFVQL